MSGCPIFPCWGFQHTQFLMKSQAGLLCDFMFNPVPDGHLQTLLQLLLLDHLCFFGCDDPSSFLESFRFLYMLLRSDPLRFKFLFALRHFYSLNLYMCVCVCARRRGEQEHGPGRCMDSARLDGEPDTVGKCVSRGVCGNTSSEDS